VTWSTKTAWITLTAGPKHAAIFCMISHLYYELHQGLVLELELARWGAVHSLPECAAHRNGLCPAAPRLQQWQWLLTHALNRIPTVECTAAKFSACSKTDYGICLQQSLPNPSWLDPGASDRAQHLALRTPTSRQMRFWSSLWWSVTGKGRISYICCRMHCTSLSEPNISTTRATTLSSSISALLPPIEHANAF
jgi:hypothetical protein